jgi:hypothetical protein
MFLRYLRRVQSMTHPMPSIGYSGSSYNYYSKEKGLPFADSPFKTI